MPHNFAKLIDKLHCQYLSCYPITLMDWQTLPVPLSPNMQQQLLRRTHQHSLNQKQPLKKSYQLNFLKTLIQLLERQNQDTEVHDAIYTSYCDLLNQSKYALEADFSYKHYVLLERDATVSLLESKCFVVGGTTGLCTWQAGIALADYLLKHPELVLHKNILELGAGSGLCSIIAKQQLGVDAVLVTDGSHECLRLIKRNVELNFTMTQQQPIVAWLEWANCADFDWENSPLPDVLLAADVIYDAECLPELVACLDYIFKLRKNQVKLLLTATIRNEKTINTSIELLSQFRFDVSRQKLTASDNILFYDTRTPIELMTITRT